MRRVPRPQVRPVHAARLLFHEGLLRGHQGDWPGARPRQERVGIVTGAAHAATATAVRRTERAPRPSARAVGRETGEPGPRRAEWEKQLLARYESGELAWRFQRPVSAKSQNVALLKIYNDEPVDFTNYDGSNGTSERKPGNGLIVAGGPNPDTETYTVAFKPGEGSWTALGINVVQDESLPGIRVARGADRMVLSEVEAELMPVKGPAQKLPFSGAAANLSNQAQEYLPIGAIDGDLKTGWAISAYNEQAKAFLALRFAQPVRTAADSVITVRIHQDSEIRRATMGRFQLALSSGEYSWAHPDKGKEIPDAVLRALRIPEEIGRAS